MNKLNLDGAFFGPSLAHIFLTAYKSSIVLPPKVFYYEPKMFGFTIAGKRGSKFFSPCKQSVQETNERLARLTQETAIKKSENSKVTRQFDNESKKGKGKRTNKK